MLASSLKPTYQRREDQYPCMNRLDAAQALLDVCPSVAISSSHEQNSIVIPRNTDFASFIEHRNSGRQSSLDALATLASKSQDEPYIAQPNTYFASTHWSSSSDEDSEAMPPPPPRKARSISNPEGMEKWDSLSRAQYQRRHFVLPSSIIEEELAEAKVAMAKMEMSKDTEDGYDHSSALSTSPDSVVSPIQSNSNIFIPSTIGNKSHSLATNESANLEPAALLKRARSRLLEDLSEGSLHGEKGVLTLPHSLAKYKEVYNKNGRIGIYTPAERAAIIARYNLKRSRRVWNKKIRYNCRKNLADRRLRVKGRFVKRTTSSASSVVKRTTTKRTIKTIKEQATLEKDEESIHNQDMPDVNDPEAGFAPTEDQPYRRLRRHTIT